MKRILGVSLIIFFLSAYFSGISIRRNDPDEQVDKFIEEQMNKFHITGLSLAVVKNGEIIKSRGYGLSNVEYHLPAREDSVYQLASVTKQFTATAIMVLVEQNKIDLDNKIAQYLTDLPLEWQNVTVRHLLNHTSGIVNYTALPEFWQRNLYSTSKEEIVKLVTKYPLEFLPGDAFNYCNTGYVLLGMIIEKVSGQAYADFLKERIFTPLNMKDTRVNDLQPIIINRASGYIWNSRVLNARYWDQSWAYGAGALISTVTDLAKWDAALYTEKIVTRKSLEQMWAQTKLNNGTTVPYGFGWGTGKINGHRVVSHNGGIIGFCSNISRFLDDRITVIVLINEVPIPVDFIAFNVANFYIEGLLPPDYKPGHDLNHDLIQNDFLERG
jgi:D-alanyl-D-alanine carboxypeptidase